MMQRWVAMACAGALGMLAGCAQTPTRGSGSSTNLNGLYAQLKQASGQYDQALQQARRGDSAQSQKTLESALDAMRSASDQCVNTSGCDTARFLSAYDRALRLKDGSFLGTEGDDQTLDTEDQNAAGSDSSVLTTLPQAQRTVQLLHDHKLSDLVATNGTVQAALQVWLTRLRPNLIRAYVDYQYLRYQMWPAFHQAGLPEAILFGLIAKESGGNVHAISRSGAAGPLQFMPATGSRFGLNTIDGFDQRFDPTMSAQATAAYLNEQLGQLNDNLALVLAAYNGGEGRMGRLITGTPDASFWNPDVYFSLSAETREYVPMVLAAAWLFLHPQRYNLHFPKVDGAPGYVNLTSAASLNELSVCLGDDDGAHYGWYRTLRNLNPQMDPSQVQPQGTRINLPMFLQTAYKQSCTDGKWVALASQLQAAQPPTPPVQVAVADPPPVRKAHRGSSVHYTVRNGDTLYAIARRFQCDDVREIARDNHLRSTTDLQVGKRLRLVGCKR
ncbi:MAG: LysM peptidoglycan-binding domain-containing protein [Rhodanobacteraceae bacterium]|nr:MAG: LysM peptidoglycan-binding domain-containing protein [Rhodanobacteraceae bacterium]